MKAHRTRGTADDRRDSHPLRCSFPRDLHLRLHWSTFSRLQFKAEGPDFHTELIPVHSPLLRESRLVSFPALTYMLKFSAWSCLTSCLGVEAVKPSKWNGRNALGHNTQQRSRRSGSTKLVCSKDPDTLDASALTQH